MAETDRSKDESDDTLSKGATSIYVMALDGLVNVNSLFTLAVFAGLTMTSPGQSNLVDATSHPGCIASEGIERDLLTFQVVSFSSFLFSSLVAQGLKEAIVLMNSKKVKEVFKANINKTFLRAGMLLSAAGSVCGSIFLMLALMNMIQIKLGTLSCGSIWPRRAVIPLFMLVPTGVVIYICIVMYAFLHY